jgi:hypothetical protein
MKTILSIAMMGAFLFAVGCGPKAQQPAQTNPASAPAPSSAPVPSSVPGAPPA